MSNITLTNRLKKSLNLSIFSYKYIDIVVPLCYNIIVRKRGGKNEEKETKKEF